MMAGDFYDVFLTGQPPHGRGDRRRGRPRDRAVHHRLPGQVPAAHLPAHRTGTRPRPSRSSTRCCRPAAGPRTWCRCAWSCSTPRRAPCATPRPAIPPAWLWQDSEMRALRSTGPLLTLDPAAVYFSREVPLTTGDVLLLYTDGLAEARSGGPDLRRGPHRRHHPPGPGPGRHHPVQDPARGGPGLRRRSRSATTWPSSPCGGSEPQAAAVPWCDDCSKFWNPPSMGPGGECPTCGKVLAPPRRRGALALQADARGPGRLHGVPDLLAGGVAAQAHLNQVRS